MALATDQGVDWIPVVRQRARPAPRAPRAWALRRRGRRDSIESSGSGLPRGNRPWRSSSRRGRSWPGTAPGRGSPHSTSGRVAFPARRGRRGVGSRPGLSEHSERIGLNHLGRPVVGRPAPSHLPARERRLPGVTRRSSAPFGAGKRTRQPAGRIRPLPPEQDPGVTTPFPLYVRRPAHDSSGLGVKYRLQRRFASTAVADVALSSQPAVALRPLGPTTPTRSSPPR